MELYHGIHRSATYFPKLDATVPRSTRNWCELTILKWTGGPPKDVKPRKIFWRMVRRNLAAKLPACKPFGWRFDIFVICCSRSRFLKRDVAQAVDGCSRDGAPRFYTERWQSHQTRGFGLRPKSYVHPRGPCHQISPTDSGTDR